MIYAAIIGAGPYGLSLAAHFKSCGIPFRIFGRPMDSWLNRMPKGMCLKSDGFASNIYDPDGELTLERFCAGRRISYSDSGIPVALDTFTAYGLAFKERFVSELDQRMVVHVERLKEGFCLRLEDGEELPVRRVVLAIGITHFQHVPANFSNLPSEYLSHSAAHHDLEPFRGRDVTVLGGGSSALDLAGLLHETGAKVTLVARQSALKFHGAPVIGKPRSTWERIRYPKSGLGPGLRSRFYANSPLLFHYLPQSVRLDIVRTHLGPSGGWFIKDKVVGKVPLILGHEPERAELRDGGVRLFLRGADGTKRELDTQHIISATGYKVNLDRLRFLSQGIRSDIKLEDRTPALSESFESSVSGLYFVGVSAANSFGPVMRFAFGAGFTAQHLTEHLAKLLSVERPSAVVAGAETVSR
jgi:thioredoxin reductase